MSANVFGQDIEALKKSLETEKDPIAQIKLLGKIASNCDVNDIEKYTTQSFDIIKNLKPEVAKINHDLILAEEARANNNLSFYFFRLALYSKSEDYAMKAILSLEKSHLDAALLASANNNLASVYSSLKNYDKAIAIYYKNLTFDKIVKDEKSVSIDYNNLSSAFRQTYNTDSAIYYARKSIEIKEKLQLQNELITSYRLLGTIYLEASEIDSSRIYLDKAFNTSILSGNTAELPLTYYWKAMVEKSAGFLPKAEGFLVKALEQSKSSGTIANLDVINLELYKLYEIKKNYAGALFHFKEYRVYADSLNSENQEKESQIKQVKFDFSKKEIELKDKQEREKAIADADKKRQQLIIFFGAGGLVLIVGFLIFALNRARVLNKQKKFIQTQQAELVDKNKLLDKKNTTITENINYAQNIQDSLIPSEEKLKTMLNKDCFVMFQPKDIVSGDFYWAYTKNNKQLFLLADCTGHGVTGAFISILAIKSLEKAVDKYELTNLPAILKQISNDFVSTFGTDEGNHFGIELVLCCFDTFSSKMLISGSSNTVCVVNNGQLENYAFENLALGTKDTTVDNAKVQELQLESNSTLYMFTDGFPDQKGGENKKKYLSKNLRNKLIAISTQPMPAQKQELVENFATWKQDIEQADDVSIVGIKIS